MDNKTIKELQDLTANVPEDLKKNLYVSESDNLQEELKERSLRNLEKIKDPQKREEVRKQIVGSASFSEKKENPRVAAEINKYYETKLEKMFKSGELKVPERDAFRRDIRK